MPTYRSIEYAHRDESPPGHTNEVRTPDALVEDYLAEYSEPGDRAFDIFAGDGTTSRAAKRLDRVPFGLEFDDERVSISRNVLPIRRTFARGTSSI